MTRLPNVHRAVNIATDPKGQNFAVIQVCRTIFTIQLTGIKNQIKIYKNYNAKKVMFPESGS